MSCQYMTEQGRCGGAAPYEIRAYRYRGADAEIPLTMWFDVCLTHAWEFAVEVIPMTVRIEPRRGAA